MSRSTEHGPECTREHPACKLGGVTDLDFLAFDADNHYYEALDAFTRHLDPTLGSRAACSGARSTGASTTSSAGVVSHAVVNPTFDPIAKAGAMHDYFRGNPNKLQPYEFLRDREPIPAEYRDRDARIAKLDEFGLEAVWLFPTLGILYEELLKHDIEAVTTTVHRVQPLARRRLGLRLPGPDLRRRRTSRSPTSTGRSASSSGRSTTARARS